MNHAPNTSVFPHPAYPQNFPNSLPALQRPLCPPPVAVQPPSQPMLYNSVSVVQQQQVQQVPVQHVYPSQVQYGGETSYTTSTICPSSYSYTDATHYTQTAPTSYYYEAPSASGAQVAAPTMSQTVPMTAWSDATSMFVTNTTLNTANFSRVTVATGSGGGAGATAERTAKGSSNDIQRGYMMSRSSGNQKYPHSIRASHATMQWLLDNFETAEGVSLSRATVFSYYLLHCLEQKQEPMIAASFGKLIRSVFMGLRTRRLGTRANSKYHYYGLRMKASSTLLQLTEDQQHQIMSRQPFPHTQRS